MNIKDTFVASLVPIFLGFGFVIAKPAFESFPPILLMGLRFMFAASILIWWFPIPRGHHASPKREPRLKAHAAEGGRCQTMMSNHDGCGDGAMG